jgi:hypothetical protein
MYWHAIPLSGNILKTSYGMHMKNITSQTYVGKLVPKEVTLLIVWGHSAKTLTRRIFVLKKMGSRIHCRAKTSGIVLG